MSTTFPAEPAGPPTVPPSLLLVLAPQALSAATERTARHPASALLRASLIQLPLVRFRASRCPVRRNVIAASDPAKRSLPGLTQRQSAVDRLEERELTAGDSINAVATQGRVPVAIDAVRAKHAAAIAGVEDRRPHLRAHRCPRAV